MYLNDILKNENKNEKGFFKHQSAFSYFNNEKESRDKNIKNKILECLDVTVKNKEIVIK